MKNSKIKNKKPNSKYKVIANYPSSPFSIGDIITYDGVIFGTGQPQKFERNPEKYPHLFKKL